MAKTGSLKLYIIIAIVAVVFLPPFVKYQELRYRNRKLDAKIKALEAESRRLTDEKKRLESDITYVEKRAREKIGVVRKGEIIIKDTARQ